MPTLETLEQLKDQIDAMNTEESECLSHLLRTEINRRKRAGRPASHLSRREQNRLAQQRFRAKKKVIDK